jgi:glycerol uptake facilitator-like aquaporin
MGTRADPLLAVCSELVGTACLLFAAISALRLTIPGGLLSGADRLLDGRTLVVGAAIAGEVVAFGASPLGRRSGAQLNPAVTVMMWLRRELSRSTAGAYVLGQMTGSVLGVAVARTAWGASVARIDVDYGRLQPGRGVGGVQTAIGELAMTCLLLLTLVMLAKVRRRYAQLGVFTVIASMIWLGGGWTGAGFNPARNFGPALATGNFRDQASYVTAPLLASLLVARLGRPRPTAYRTEPRRSRTTSSQRRSRRSR